MTKKDYELIVRCVREGVDRACDQIKKPSEEECLDAIGQAFAEELGKDNSRFDRGRFMAAIRGE